jgi:GDPmannose 4,6-dehydratase
MRYVIGVMQKITYECNGWVLQQDQAEDFVIATGKQISVREFVRMSAAEAGITIEFTAEALNEVATVTAITGTDAPSVKVGDVIVKVDPRFFRPAEVETLLGDPTKAKEKLGWVPEITVEEMCAEMVKHDLDKAEQHVLLKKHGFDVAIAKE